MRNSLVHKSLNPPCPRVAIMPVDSGNECHEKGLPHLARHGCRGGEGDAKSKKCRQKAASGRGPELPLPSRAGKRDTYLSGQSSLCRR